MSLKNKMNESTTEYCDRIRVAANAINNAERIIVGVGAGMSASGGLNYSDPALSEKWYPDYYAMGKKSIVDIMAGYWPTSINNRNATAFWGFWAKHIYHIRYEPEVLQPYSHLYRITNGKKHFICSSNVDGQLEKAGFDKDVIFAPQGDYALFQCEKPCSHEVYDNKIMIDAMFANMADTFEIRQDDVPLCPKCGGFLMPNLRCDHRFVEKPHVQSIKRYEQFFAESFDCKTVLLELGVGYNTPGIIRFPFESLAVNYRSMTLIRINLYDADVPGRIADRAVSIKEDVGNTLNDILAIL